MGNDSEHGRSTSDRVQIIGAVLGLVGLLGAAVISNWDKIFPQKPSIQVASEANNDAAPSTASRAHPPRPSAAMPKMKGPLFVVGPPDSEGASVSAHIINALQGKGFRIANGRGGAKLLIEIQAPDLEPTQVSPTGGSEGFSVVTTLTAKMLSISDSTGNIVPMQRQALGMGATETEARQNSIAAVTDRLGKSIADVLQ